MVQHTAKTNGYLIVKGEEDVKSLVENIIKHTLYRKHLKLVSLDHIRNTILAYLSLDWEPESNILIHGRFFDHQNSIKSILNFYENIKDGYDRIFPQEIDGDFSFAIFDDDKIFALRSPASSKPLYFSSGKKHFILSSDPYSLRSNGLDCQPLQPSTYLYVNFSRNILLCKRYYDYNFIEIESVDGALNLLSSALKYSLEKNLDEVKNVAIAFSGGLDSSIVAKLALLLNLRPYLITVCLKKSHDYIHSEKVSSLLSLEHKIIELDEERLALKARLLSKIIGRENLMNLSIAIILNSVAEEASSAGFQNLVIGQGADELFGGYKKYVSFAERGYDVNKILKYDFEKLQSIDISRDDASTAMYCEPVFPYINRRVAEAAFSIPIKYKINFEKDERKIVLRKLAMELDLPQEAYGSQKKAMQYSSGVQKALAKLPL
ncbi:MAG: asparagine synthetase B [Nitrososphaeria archaeon]|nr:asparagine synthetase B [Nitrososphaeria archaeon]